MSSVTLNEIEKVFAEAELLFSSSKVEAALDRMGVEITRELAGKNPVVMCLMVGAVIPVGLLLPRLNFPLQIDYVHATRYRGATSGGEISWLKSPEMDITGRTVLIVDDILDQGLTLESIIKECKKMNAGKIYTAVLADKKIDKPRPVAKADFTGLVIPNRYVFGYGMDYKSYLRNAPGIYAVKGL